jgi:ribonuclease PH
MAIKYLKAEGVITTDPITKQAAAISVGLYQDTPVLDVDYPEDSKGEADMNVVMSSDGGFIEVQGTGEERPMTRTELDEMMRLAEKGCMELFEAQRKAIG